MPNVPQHKTATAAATQGATMSNVFSAGNPRLSGAGCRINIDTDGDAHADAAFAGP